ncbi:MAG: N-acetylmuramoyl-L-alanine amidase LytC [Candidatus Dichloromethanomonas elyunquensis]|nr:MAG: N-acetylmuramoyl-L-alanine amidase LytC [Candidatus Dichloromethanomonas elyunquensis]
MKSCIFFKNRWYKIILFFTIIAFVFNYSSGIMNSLTAYADDATKNTERLAGDSRYATAIEISSNNWVEAYHVVLARGDAFPDALAGAVLANSPEVGGPLLLTESNDLRSDVWSEIQRLNANTVYILGGTCAISAGVENTLKSKGLQVVRIQGTDRYETAANISAQALQNSIRAFLVSGQNFADALSISSYAAAQGIPLLLTPKDNLPSATLDALQRLRVTDITLIGGDNAIGPSVEDQLLLAGYRVERLSGDDRFQTNIQIMNRYPFNLDSTLIATGMSFPDALAGSVLAANNNNPVVLVPKNDGQIPGSLTDAYLAANRDSVNNYLILGGSGAVNYKIEFYIRNGKFNPRVSLQFWDGYADKSCYERLLSYVPGNLTDSVQILVPNFTGDLGSDGRFGCCFPDSSTPRYLVSLGQSKGAKVVPMVQAKGAVANGMLLDPAKRAAFVDSTVKLVQETGADGILVDLESLADNTQQGLTGLMKDIYGRLNPESKLVVISVMSKTSRTAEPWYNEYNYHDLAGYADYVQIMSYDFSYSDSSPGPVAPLDWVRKVMSYALTEIPSEKILMGVPYYGRAWEKTGKGWVSQSFGLAKANMIAAQYGAAITRETTPADPVGIPTFHYVDESGTLWTVYFDDRKSWEAKFGLVEQYNLGGVGGWAMGWINEVSSSELYPLLQEMT